MSSSTRPERWWVICCWDGGWAARCIPSAVGRACATGEGPRRHEGPHGTTVRPRPPPRADGVDRPGPIDWARSTGVGLSAAHGPGVRVTAVVRHGVVADLLPRSEIDGHGATLPGVLVDLHVVLDAGARDAVVGPGGVGVGDPALPPPVVPRPVGALAVEVGVLPDAEVPAGAVGRAGGGGQGEAAGEGEQGRGCGEGETLGDHEGSLPFFRVTWTVRSAYRSAA